MPKAKKNEKYAKMDAIKGHKIEETREEDLENPKTEIVEKIIYKKQRVHGFFRTLTILVLLVIGFLLLGESMNIAKITIGNFALATVYPIFIIFSTIVIRSYRDIFGKLFGLILFLGVFGGFFTIRTYNSLDETAVAKFGEQIVFEITGSKTDTITIKTLATNIELEGNTKSPYVQGTRNADRKITTDNIISGTQHNILIQEDTTLNLLYDLVSNLNLYIPSKTNFQNIYIRNARGTENIHTQDMNRNKITLNGGINRIMLDINDIAPQAEIEIQGAIQDITINIPKEIGIQMRYKNKIGYKNTPNLAHQTGYLYTSDGLSTAKKILTLDINIFIGKLEINWK